MRIRWRCPTKSWLISQKLSWVLLRLETVVKPLGHKCESKVGKKTHLRQRQQLTFWLWLLQILQSSNEVIWSQPWFEKAFVKDGDHSPELTQPSPSYICIRSTYLFILYLLTMIENQLEEMSLVLLFIHESPLLTWLMALQRVPWQA